MIKATLKYTDCFQDGKIVYQTLIENKAVLIATKPPLFGSICPRVIVLFSSLKHMYETLYDLNRTCNYEVALVKFKHLKGKK